MPWWLEKPMRLVQTNLREIDADLDPDEFMRQLHEFSANVLLFNVGGIVANYPTDLEFHWRNPYLRNDLVGEILERARREGIRFLARFDFSKINESLAARHPEWLYVSATGETVNYNGQVHTCLNGGYQQDYAHEVLAEAIGRYPFDGVFFNMFGYQTRDYSGIRHGICQCGNCRSRFHTFCGEELPSREISDEEVSLKYYQRFQAHTVREKIEAIAAQIKRYSRELAVCTYVTDAVDIVRRESNSAVDRPKPEWNYSATEHTCSVLSSWRDKTVSNSAVHFLDIPYRHVGVSPHLTAARLAENLANAAWLDYYVIGPLERQDDRACFDIVKDLYRFHAENERWYAGVEPVGDVCLIRPGAAAQSEFRGLLRLLAEHHVLFHIVDEGQAAKSGILSTCQAAILPDASILADDLKRALDAYVAEGGRLLATGLMGVRDAEGRSTAAVDLECLGHPEIREILPARRGSYWRVASRDKQTLRGLDDMDLFYIDDEALHCASPDGAQRFLGYIPGQMYGPPEKCYYSEETSIPGLISMAHGKGVAAFVPWRLGRHYASQGNHGHAALFRAILFDLLGLRPSIRLDASPLIEIRSQVRSDGAWQLLSFVNHSGQNGASFLPPMPAHDIEVAMKTRSLPLEARALRLGRPLPMRLMGERMHGLTLPRLELFETIVLRFA